MKIIIGIILGIVLTLIILNIRHYLSDNHLVINWRNVFIAIVMLVIIIWISYSIIGMIFGPVHVEASGNTYQGYKYGLKIGSGDINAE